MVYGGNVEIIPIRGVYKVFARLYFASEGQIIEPPSVTVQGVAVTTIV